MAGTPSKGVEGPRGEAFSERILSNIRPRRCAKDEQ